MAMVSDMLGASGALIEFTHDGETYRVTPVTQEVKSAIEQALRAAAYADLYAQRASMPADQYAEAMKIITRDRASYAYLGPVYWETVGTDEGTLLMVRLLFQTTADKAAKLISDRGEDVQGIVEDHILASMPRDRAKLVRAKMEERRKANPTRPA